MTGSSASKYNVSSSHVGCAREGLALSEQDLHLWLCSRERVTSSDEFKRWVLSRYASVSPADWRFALDGQGKPRLVDSPCALDFNLSHSGTWLACAVTAGTPVGVDLEFCDRGRDALKLARRFFREEEAAVLATYSGAQQRDRFYDLWTLKEAALKARGEALAPGLASRGFELTFPPGAERATGRIALTTPDSADSAQYCLLDPLTAYRLAVCWPADTHRPPRLRLFELHEGEVISELIVALRASTWLE